MTVAQPVTRAGMLDLLARRDRLVVIAGLVAVIAMAWGWLLAGAGSGMTPVEMTAMAGMDGWKVAETLRANGHHQARILLVSASALEAHGAPLAQPYHDGYLMKPIDIPRLLETIRELLKIEWIYAIDQIPPPRWRPENGSRPPVKHVEELIGIGRIGYVRAIQVKLDEIGSEFPEHADFVAQMRALVDRFDLDQYMATLKALHSYDH